MTWHTANNQVHSQAGTQALDAVFQRFSASMNAARLQRGDYGTVASPNYAHRSLLPIPKNPPPGGLSAEELRKAMVIPNANFVNKEIGKKRTRNLIEISGTTPDQPYQPPPPQAHTIPLPDGHDPVQHLFNGINSFNTRIEESLHRSFLSQLFHLSTSLIGEFFSDVGQFINYMWHWDGRLSSLIPSFTGILKIAFVGLFLWGAVQATTAMSALTSTLETIFNFIAKAFRLTEQALTWLRDWFRYLLR